MSGHKAFQSIVDLVGRHESQHLAITEEDFEQWKKLYTFEGLRGIRYGQSFCNHFGITDNILYYSLTPDQADIYINEKYIERT